MGRGEEAAETRFEIFRRADAVSLEESGIMTMPEMLDHAGIGEVMQAGPESGYLTRVLYATPTFSLVYLWYKSGYMLPRHTHNVDCLYAVIGGSLQRHGLGGVLRCRAYGGGSTWIPSSCVG